MQPTDNVIPFPFHLANCTRQEDGSRNVRFATRRGMVDIYFGEDGMANLDACLPTVTVLRLLDLIQTT